MGPLYWANYRDPDRNNQYDQVGVVQVDLNTEKALIIHKRTIMIVPLREVSDWARWD